MIDYLATLLAAFPGSANRTRCFTHILNLVAKCIMKQFDTPKKKKPDNEVPADDEDEDVADLQLVLDELDGELEDDIGKDGDNWEFDMCIELTEEELEETVKPICHVLTKVN